MPARVAPASVRIEGLGPRARTLHPFGPGDGALLMRCCDNRRASSATRFQHGLKLRLRQPAVLCVCEKASRKCAAKKPRGSFAWKLRELRHVGGDAPRLVEVLWPPTQFFVFQRTTMTFIRLAGAKDDPLAATKDDPPPTTTANGPAHTDNPKRGNMAAEDPNNGANRRAVSKMGGMEGSGKKFHL